MNKDEIDELLKYLRNKSYRQERLDGGFSVYSKGNIIIHEAIVGEWSVTDQNTGKNIPILNKEDFLTKFPYVKRLMVEDKVVEITKQGNPRKFAVNEIDWTKVRPSDMIEIDYQEGYYSENNSYDATSTLIISRSRFATDTEHEIHLKELEKLKNKSKKERYEQYLKLKEEFENVEKPDA